MTQLEAEEESGWGTWESGSANSGLQACCNHLQTVGSQVGDFSFLAHPFTCEVGIIIVSSVVSERMEEASG